jgi:hypothetical protein
MPTVSISLEEQIAHIEEHREAFRKHQRYQSPFGDTGDVRGYFRSYVSTEGIL